MVELGDCRMMGSTNLSRPTRPNVRLSSRMIFHS